MKKLIVGITLVAASISVWAACSTSTVSYGGRLVTCTTCCDSHGNCNTNCF